MTIVFTRTGGVAGIVRRLELDLARLPANEAEELRRLVAESGFFGLEAVYRAGHPDAFEYTIEVDDGTRHHRVTTGERAAPPALQPLITALRGRVRR